MSFERGKDYDERKEYKHDYPEERVKKRKRPLDKIKESLKVKNLDRLIDRIKEYKDDNHEESYKKVKKYKRKIDEQMIKAGMCCICKERSTEDNPILAMHCWCGDYCTRCVAYHPSHEPTLHHTILIGIEECAFLLNGNSNNFIARRKRKPKVQPLKQKVQVSRTRKKTSRSAKR